MTDTDDLPRAEIEARMAKGLKRALKPLPGRPVSDRASASAPHELARGNGTAARI